jgi:hypothetical protein
MSKWDDFLIGIERKDDLESLIEEISHEIGLLKSRNFLEENRLKKIKSLLSEIKLKGRKITHQQTILENKISILEEDLDL